MLHSLTFATFAFQREPRPAFDSTDCRSRAIGPRTIGIALLTLVLAALVPGPLAAVEPKVVFVVADYLTLSDLLDDPPPGIARLVEQGAVGLVSPGAMGARTPESAYVTASAGAPCVAAGDIDQAFTSTESVEDEADQAGDVFRRRTGEAVAPSVVHLEMPRLVRENEERIATSLPGALADALAGAGKRTAAFGNSDTGDQIRRRGALLAATSSGAVDFGDVSTRILRREPTSPTGFVTDSARLAALVDAALASADFVVAEFGDTSRVELMRPRLSEDAYDAARKRALVSLGDFLSRLLDGHAGDATIILASIAPARRKTGGWERLAPIVVRRPGGLAGSLSSTTTRMPGLVLWVDVAPTVLASLGVPRPGGMTGATMSELPGGRRFTRRLDKVAALHRLALWPVLGVLAALGIGTATAASVAIAFGAHRASLASRILRGMLVSVTNIPLAILFASAGEADILGYVVRLAAWIAALTAVALGIARAVGTVASHRVSRMPGALPVIVVMIITSLVLFIDACHRGRLVRLSLLGAGDFTGYRLYGIGNEYMGVWLAMAAISIVWVRECFPGWESRRFGRVGLLLACTAIVMALGFPRFGANAGGAVTAVVGLGTIYASGVWRRFSAGHAALLAALGIAFVVGVAFADLAFARSGPTHMGLAASMASQNGYTYLLAMAGRKLTMNLNLAGTAQAETAFFGSIPFAVVWLSAVGRRMGAVADGRPAFRSGTMAILVTACAALVFNDSGVVAAGLIVGFLVMAILHTLLGILNQ